MCPIVFLVNDHEAELDLMNTFACLVRGLETRILTDSSRLLGKQLRTAFRQGGGLSLSKRDLIRFKFIDSVRAGHSQQPTRRQFRNQVRRDGPPNC